MKNIFWVIVLSAYLSAGEALSIEDIETVESTTEKITDDTANHSQKKSCAYSNYITLTRKRVSYGKPHFNFGTGTMTGGGSKRRFFYSVANQEATRVALAPENITAQFDPKSEAMLQLKKYKTRRVLTPILLTTSVVTFVAGLMAGNGESTGEKKYGYDAQTDSWGMQDVKTEYDGSKGASLFVISGISLISGISTGASKNKYLYRAVELHNLSLSQSGNLSTGLRLTAEF